MYLYTMKIRIVKPYKTITVLIKEEISTFNEGYDDMSMEDNMNRKKLSEYNDYDDKMVLNNMTYLNFLEKEPRFDPWFLWGQIKVFDPDGIEIANASYGKKNEYSQLKASIDVRGDKRRQGIASNIYEWIEKLTGETLYPDVPHSKPAEKFWNNPNRKFGVK